MALEQAGSDPAYVLNEVIGRLRSMESKHLLLSEQVLVINKNMIGEHKQLSKQMQLMNEELRESRNDMFRLKEAILDLSKEMQKFARKDKVAVLEKYIDLWNPLHFVTEEEVRKIVRKEYGKTSTSQ